MWKAAPSNFKGQAETAAVKCGCCILDAVLVRGKGGREQVEAWANIQIQCTLSATKPAAQGALSIGACTAPDSKGQVHCLVKRHAQIFYVSILACATEQRGPLTGRDTRGNYCWCWGL